MLEDNFRTANILCSLKTVIACYRLVTDLYLYFVSSPFQTPPALTRGQKNPVLQDASCKLSLRSVLTLSCPYRHINIVYLL